jgi:hypothetical protein
LLLTETEKKLVVMNEQNNSSSFLSSDMIADIKKQVLLAQTKTLGTTNPVSVLINETDAAALESFLGQFVAERARAEQEFTIKTIEHKKALEREYERKFNDYKTSMEKYVQELSLKFETKSKDILDTVELLNRKIPSDFFTLEHKRRHSTELSSAISRLHRLWEICDLTVEDIQGFLNKLERVILETPNQGKSVLAVYEEEIKKWEEKLPVLEQIAKQQFLSITGDKINSN